MSEPRADFLARAERGGMVPVLREVVLDGDTPLAAFVKVARPPFAFLLESLVGGEPRTAVRGERDAYPAKLRQPAWPRATVHARCTPPRPE